MEIRVAAMKMSSDADICAISGLSPEELEPYREMINRTRAAALASLKYHRMKAQAARIKRGANE